MDSFMLGLRLKVVVLCVEKLRFLVFHLPVPQQSLSCLTESAKSHLLKESDTGRESVRESASVKWGRRSKCGGNPDGWGAPRT